MANKSGATPPTLKAPSPTSLPKEAVRDIFAHILILCDYIDEACTLTDITVLKAKARQIKEILRQ